MEHELTKIFAYRSLSSTELMEVAPVLILSFLAVVGLFFASSKKPLWSGFTSLFCMIGLLVAMIVQGSTLYSPNLVMLEGVLVFTSLSRAVSLLIMGVGLFACLVMTGNSKREQLLPELYPLTIFSITGMSLMVLSNHLLFMFTALEIMSLAVYVMVGIKRNESFGAEAAMKYFILGGIAGAMYLYGSVLAYGATGTFSLDQIAQLSTQSFTSTPLLTVAGGLILASLLFKVGAVPFHFWVPDVYQGANVGVMGFMGTAVKFTAFIPLIKICQMMLFKLPADAASFFYIVIWICAAVTILFANLAAYGQTELKRLMAYSSIAHTGYLLTGLLLGMNSADTNSVLLYLILYCVANLGAVAVMTVVAADHAKDTSIDSLSGLAQRHPYWAMALSLFLLAMAGIPATAGFIGKYYLFGQVVSQGETMLAVIAVLGSLISMYYYLKVIVVMYMRQDTGTVQVRSSLGPMIVATVMALLTLQLGILPSGLISFLEGLK